MSIAVGKENVGNNGIVTNLRSSAWVLFDERIQRYQGKHNCWQQWTRENKQNSIKGSGNGVLSSLYQSQTEINACWSSWKHGNKLTNWGVRDS